MARYQLRAEAPHHADPWAPHQPCWHVARVGSAFALCAKQLEPATSVLPIQDAECVPMVQRCAGCWERAFTELMLDADAS